MNTGMNSEALVRETVAALERTGRFRELRDYAQHGGVSVYDHSVRVARAALNLARKLPLRFDCSSLVRGALLHDYFLYDWHTPDARRPNHALFHARVAWENAERDYGLNRIEADIVRRHMFPLVPIPPRTREGWIVCWADTCCALRETVNLNRARRILRKCRGKKRSKT